MRPPVDIAALGEVLIDFAQVSVEDDGYPVLKAQPGGAPANFLAAACRYGCTAALLSKVGGDRFGRLLKQTLADCGIDTDGVRTDPDAFTTLAFVTLDDAGERSFSFARKPGADTRLSPDEIDGERIAAARVFHFGTLSLTDEPAASATRRALSIAKAHGLLISLDPNLRLPLWNCADDARAATEWALRQADVVKISEEEIAFLWGMTVDAGCEKLLREYGVSLVYATRGANGCYAATRRCAVSVPCPAGIIPVDTTGAGDLFGGAAMSRLLQFNKRPDALTENELREIVRFAVAAASLSTERPGGIGSVPEPEEVERVLGAWST